MFFLWLSISCTVAVYLLFRVFGKQGIDVLPAIIYNYFTCAVLGHLLAEKQMLIYAQDIPDAQFHFALIMGAAFICVFYAMGRTTNLIGVSASTIVSRMSMVIPATYSVIWLGERLNGLKVMGIIMALIAIYFTVSPERKSESAPSEKKSLRLTFILLSFFGVGLVDTLLKYSQTHFLRTSPDITYVGLIYNAAFIAGLIFYLLSGESWKHLLKWKNLVGGVVLGIFNYYGIVFIYKALTESTMGGSIIFPINSVGTVALSTLMAVILFREKLSYKRMTGLFMALAAIVLIAWDTIFMSV
jgi:drug/metabolite transporter (DMT)-like permease